MKLTAVITEYNPFHNGHIYHLKQARKMTDSDGVIVIMSGNFVQRGTPAIFDKWHRTKMALLNGADLVIELPCAYAISSAESFAFGAVSIINSLNAIQNLVFGSETGDIQSLQSIAKLLYEVDFVDVKNPRGIENYKISSNDNLSSANNKYHFIQEYKHHLQASLNDGLSYPKARWNALSKTLHSSSTINTNTGYDELNLQHFNQANNILGIEYIKSLYRLNSSIKANCIKRMGGSYNSATIDGEYSSATAIRNHILHGNHCNIPISNMLQSAIPENLYDIYKNASPVNEEALYPYILYELWSKSPEDLQHIEGISEGLHHRIIKCSEYSNNYDELIENIKTKRYTRTRIQRALLSIFLNINKEFTQQIYSSGNDVYARILGANEKGRAIIKHIKTTSQIPIITNVNKFVPSSDNMKNLMELEHRADNLYTLLQSNPTCGTNKTHQPIIL